jgi:Spy/CpxP family protein refolding chaperone
MKRAIIIICLGLLAAAVGYCALYFRGTTEHRQMLKSPAPELAWLKKEFQLSDTEFERICELHGQYMPRCAELCRQIAEKNAELRQLLATPGADPKAVEQKLKEAGELRVECQKNMFNHFLAVSRQMPAEQGNRYLRWVQQRTLASDHEMAQSHAPERTMSHH